MKSSCRILLVSVALAGIALPMETVRADKPAATTRPAATMPAALPADVQADANKAAGKGLEWLMKNQKADDSWGKDYTIAVTSIACLSFLASTDEPFDGQSGKAVIKGIEFLLSKQKDGMFEQQQSTWIHGQGFATLALSEAYGRTLFCKVKPDIDVKKIKEVVEKAVKVIQDNQSDSGGWWYTPGSKSQHEGSTTVTAVQAIASAANYGLTINEDVLDKGFEYLKKCQNDDGGFDYQLGSTTSMQAGTAADVATLGLMGKFDYAVMTNGCNFMFKHKPVELCSSFAYYAGFYTCMGMKLMGDEMKSVRDKTGDYFLKMTKQLLEWQKTDGSWTPKEIGDESYATAFASLSLSVGQGRLSVFNRLPPKLPKGAKTETGKEVKTGAAK
ncbi:MAG: terpene cyclase/mutase family protein [Planctomycetes bacterium]|nr:terpene cyclase/mutase family protein [Planctomycetota bacterium]